MRAYLNLKPELEYTGQETYVDSLQRGGPNGVPDVDYFPVGEARVLESTGDGRGRRWRRDGRGGGGGGGGAGQEEEAVDR